MAGKKGDGAAFWEKPLDELTRAQWERLCDGCGRCCLVKLEDEDTGAIYHTAVACKLLDQQSCRCGDYAGRKAIVPDCVRLTLKKLEQIKWLPPTCAYLLRLAGKPLPFWHPLLSGDPLSVHRAGVSVRGRVEAGEEEVETDELPDFIRPWPKRWPKKARDGAKGAGAGIQGDREKDCFPHPHPEEPAKQASRRTRVGKTPRESGSLVLRDAPFGRSSG